MLGACVQAVSPPPITVQVIFYVLQHVLYSWLPPLWVMAAVEILLPHQRRSVLYLESGEQSLFVFGGYIFHVGHVEGEGHNAQRHAHLRKIFLLCLLRSSPQCVSLQVIYFHADVSSRQVRNVLCRVAVLQAVEIFEEGKLSTLPLRSVVVDVESRKNPMKSPQKSRRGTLRDKNSFWVFSEASLRWVSVFTLLGRVISCISGATCSLATYSNPAPEADVHEEKVAELCKLVRRARQSAGAKQQSSIEYLKEFLIKRGRGSFFSVDPGDDAPPSGLRVNVMFDHVVRGNLVSIHNRRHFLLSCWNDVDLPAASKSSALTFFGQDIDELKGDAIQCARHIASSTTPLTSVFTVDKFKNLLTEREKTAEDTSFLAPVLIATICNDPIPMTLLSERRSQRSTQGGLHFKAKAELSIHLPEFESWESAIQHGLEKERIPSGWGSCCGEVVYAGWGQLYEGFGPTDDKKVDSYKLNDSACTMYEGKVVIVPYTLGPRDYWRQGLAFQKFGALAVVVVDTKFDTSLQHSISQNKIKEQLHKKRGDCRGTRIFDPYDEISDIPRGERCLIPVVVMPCPDFDTVLEAGRSKEVHFDWLIQNLIGQNKAQGENLSITLFESVSEKLLSIKEFESEISRQSSSLKKGTLVTILEELHVLSPYGKDWLRAVMKKGKSENFLDKSSDFQSLLELLLGVYSTQGKSLKPRSFLRVLKAFKDVLPPERRALKACVELMHDVAAITDIFERFGLKKIDLRQVDTKIFEDVQKQEKKWAEKKKEFMQSNGPSDQKQQEQRLLDYQEYLKADGELLPAFDNIKKAAMEAQHGLSIAFKSVRLFDIVYQSLMEGSFNKDNGLDISILLSDFAGLDTRFAKALLEVVGGGLSAVSQESIEQLAGILFGNGNSKGVETTRFSSDVTQHVSKKMSAIEARFAKAAQSEIVKGVVALCKGNIASPESLDAIKPLAKLFGSFDVDKVEKLVKIVQKILPRINKGKKAINQRNPAKYDLNSIEGKMFEPAVLFQKIDVDKSGTVSYNEFVDAIKMVSFPSKIPDDVIMKLFIECAGVASNDLNQAQFETALDKFMISKGDSVMDAMGLSQDKIFKAVFLLTTILLLLFTFIFLGIGAFFSAGGFAAGVNALLPVSAGGIATKATNEEIEDGDNKQIKELLQEKLDSELGADGP